jgi:hypothetical protein
MKLQLKGAVVAFKHTYKSALARYKKNPLRTVLFILAGILIVVPVFNLLFLLVQHSINVPFWDQWGFADLLNKWRHGTLGIGDLWRQHNEHRLFIPQLFQILLASITGWNTRIEVMMNFLFGLGSFAVMVTLLWRTFQGRILPMLLATIVTAWLLFSPVQYINWIWGFQLAWFMSVFAAMVSIWALTNYDPKNGFDRWFVLALLTSLVATFSMSNGMLMWAIGLGLLFYKHTARKQYVTWTVTGIGAISLYFYHLVRPEQPSPLWLLRHRAHELTDYTLQFLGRNLAFTPPAAQKAGIVLLVLLGTSIVLLVRKKRLANVVPWLAIASYGLITAFLAAFSRMYTFGVDHSMVQSYTTMSALFVIGTLVTVIYSAAVYLEKASTAVMHKYLLIAFTLGIIAFPLAGNFWHNYITGVRQLKELGLHFSRVRDCVFTVRSPQDPCLDIVYPDRVTAVRYINELTDLNWDHLRDNTKGRRISK